MIRDALHAPYFILISAMGLASLGLVYFAALIFRAWFEVHEAPKTDFYTCDKHGAIPAKCVIDIQGTDGDKPIKGCPFCFEDAYKTADARLKAEETKPQRVTL